MEFHLLRHCRVVRMGIKEIGGSEMRYLHTLDPDDFLEYEDYLKALDAERAAELAAEEARMEKYYEKKN